MQFAAKCAASLVLASLALGDMRSRRLPSRAVLLVACLYGVDAAMAGVSIGSFATHLTAAMIASLGFALLFRFGWMGGGDVKLATAVFLWAGFTYAWPVFAIVSCSGLILGLTVLAIDRYRQPATARAPESAPRAEPRGLPYGVPLAFGGFAAVWLPVLNGL
jgi:prepilin peptidase CpaA